MGNQTGSVIEKNLEGFSDKDRLYGFINVKVYNID